MELSDSSSLGKKFRDAIQDSEYTAPALLSISVGLLAGLGAVVFRYLIQGIHWLFFDGGKYLSDHLDFLPFSESYIILAPAIGLVLVSAIVRRWAMEAKGHGIPEVQYAVRKRKGHIRLRVAFVKAIASALCIGSGGSVGREGPIVQIGSSLGSTIGRVAGLREQEVKLLLACGAAGGIGATFNAPIAGVMFALEVILGTFAARSFGLVVISSVTAVALSHAFLGKQPAFELIQPFALRSPWEFPLYLFLGLFAGVVSLAYVRSVYYFEEAFERWKVHDFVKAFCGGLGIGLMGFFGSRYLFGVGYDGVEAALAGTLGLKLLLMLVVLKILATSLTLGAGGSGGVFAPALFIGVMLGGAFGVVANMLFPGVAAPSGAYALVGMAALFSGAAHAPITAVLIIFEMTDDYMIILPLMLSAVVSYLVASRLSPDSIYTIKLRRLGGFAPTEQELGILDMILVRDAMVTDYRTIDAELPISEMMELYQQETNHAFPVVNAQGKLVGVATKFDVERAAVEGTLEGYTVADIMTTDLITCTTDESLRRALRRFTQKDIHQIIVVDSEDMKKIQGLLLRSEILWAYNEFVDEQKRVTAKHEMELSPDEQDSVQVELCVRREHKKISFKKVRDLDLPAKCLIAFIRRADRSVIPKGDTIIEPGDVLVLLTTRLYQRKLKNWISELNERG